MQSISAHATLIAPLLPAFGLAAAALDGRHVSPFGPGFHRLACADLPARPLARLCRFAPHAFLDNTR